MREFQHEDAVDGTNMELGARKDGSDSRRESPTAVHDAGTRKALALEYRQRVEAEDIPILAGQPKAQDNLVSRAAASNGAASPERPTAEREGFSESEPRQRPGQTRATELPAKTGDLPNAQDVLPNLDRAEFDGRKLSEYSMRPDHPQNNGKAEGWRALGYDVDNPQERQKLAQELRGLVLDELLARGKVAESRDTDYGPMHRVLNGIKGPNGRDATLNTCWLVDERSGESVPRLTTVWVQPHRDKEGMKS